MEQNSQELGGVMPDRAQSGWGCQFLGRELRGLGLGYGG